MHQLTIHPRIRYERLDEFLESFPLFTDVLDRNLLGDRLHIFKQVAFFCTEGGLGDRLVFSELSRLCGQAPVATYQVTEPYLAEPTQQEPLSRFMERLEAT